MGAVKKFLISELRQKKEKINSIMVWGTDIECFVLIYLYSGMYFMYICIDTYTYMFQWGALLSSLPPGWDRHSARGLAAVTHRTCDFLVMGCFLCLSTVSPCCACEFQKHLSKIFIANCKKYFFTSRPGANIILFSLSLQTFPQQEDSQLHQMANVNR